MSIPQVIYRTWRSPDICMCWPHLKQRFAPTKANSFQMDLTLICCQWHHKSRERKEKVSNLRWRRTAVCSQAPPPPAAAKTILLLHPVMCVTQHRDRKNSPKITFSTLLIWFNQNSMAWFLCVLWLFPVLLSRILPTRLHKNSPSGTLPVLSRWFPRTILSVAQTLQNSTQI